MEEERSRVQASRARRAAFVVLVFCALVAIICAVSCAVENDGVYKGAAFGNEVDGSATGDVSETTDFQGTFQFADGSYAASIWDALSRGESFDEAVEQVGFQIIDAKNAPQWFESEIAPITAFERIFANSERNIFELQMQGTQEGALNSMRAYMEQKGWQQTRSEMAGVATFNKTEGECRWAMLECAEMNGMCCMVLHIQLG